jgi:hypothetical protein
MLWAIGNCVYVYVVLDGHRSYRIESAVLGLVVLMLPRVLAGRKPSDAVTLSRALNTAVIGTVTGIWLATFLPLLSFPLLSDDFVFLSRYTNAVNAIHSPFFFRPAFAIVFMMLSRIGSGTPVPFHVVSLLLHFVAACLVYLLARRLFDDSTAAIVCFTIFLLNPLQLEATLWASGLQELLWTLFALAAVRSYVWSDVLTIGRVSVTTLLLIGALLSKETAVCLFLLLPAADAAFFPTRIRQGLIGAYATFAVLFAAYMLARRQFVSIEPNFFTVHNLFFWKQFSVVPYKFFAQPWNTLAADIPPWVPLMVSVSMIGLVFAAVQRNPSPRLLFGPALILISTLPLYSYFYVGTDLLAARYLYCATIGWGILIAELLSSATRQRAWAVVTALSVTTVMLVMSLQINLRPWRLAGDLVRSMEGGLKEGKLAGSIVDEWQHRTGVRLEMRNGVPYQYEGVGIFINGYPEFLQLATNGQQTDRFQ